MKNRPLAFTLRNIKNGLSPVALATLEQLETEQGFSPVELTTRILENALLQIERERR